jgi:hypothetical protein
MDQIGGEDDESMSSDMSERSKESPDYFVAFLREHFPRDVPMPCAKNAKAPLFTHTYNSWTWRDYDSFLKRQKQKQKRTYPEFAVTLPFTDRSTDLCVVLSDLCVVDVDGRDLVAAFEKRFEMELQSVPRVDTALGRHYWFIRTKEADELGYFDGSAQRTKGVDFKSVCRSGTGGVVCVPHSANKRWVFSKDEEEIEYGDQKEVWPFERVAPIPFEILDTVAVPRHRVSTLTELELSFEPPSDVSRGIFTVPACKNIQGMAYFEPFLESAFRSDGEHLVTAVDDIIRVPVPCRSDLFFELLHVLVTGELADPLPDVDLLRDLAWLARFLGVARQEQVVRMIATGTPLIQVASRKMFPEWWDARVIECGHTFCDADLIDLTAWTSPLEIRYAPVYAVPRAYERLFSELLVHNEALERPHGFVAGDVIMNGTSVSNAHLRSALDGRVQDVLGAFPETAVLAGGAALAALVPSLPKASDYDIFLVGLDDDASCDAALARIRDTLVGAPCTDYGDGDGDVFVGKGDGSTRRYYDAAKGVHMTETGNAVTFVLTGSKPHEDVVVQVIVRRYATLAQLLSSFDFGPCKVAVYRKILTVAASTTTADTDFAVRCAPTWVPCMRRMAFPIDLKRWSTSSVYRTYKYLSKGFEVYVPGASRLSSAKNERNVYGMRTGVPELFALERNTLSRLKIIRPRHWLPFNVPFLKRCFTASKECVRWPNMDDVSPYLYRCCRGDYEAKLEETRRFKYVVINLVKHGYRWLTDNAQVKRTLRWTASGMVRTRRIDVIINKTNTAEVVDLDEAQANKRVKMEDDGEDSSDAQPPTSSVRGKTIERWPVYESQSPIFNPANVMWNLVSYSDMDPVFG